MDPIEILGSLLGQKAGGSGKGADILKDILLGGTRRQSSPKTGPSRESQTREAPSREASGSSWREPAGDDIERQARELEDLLNVATGRSGGRPSSQPQPQPQSRQPAPRPSAEQPSRDSNWLGQGQDQSSFDTGQDDAESRQSQQAMILIRAMVNAAKCDGQVSPAEQQAILGQLTNPSPDAIQFLRDEFAKPLDVREFAWSVPVGIEQQVYSMSLIAIDLDSDREQRYLAELAHGLRLAPEVCNEIKARLTGSNTRHAAAR